jgi:hypothetical protein
LFVFFSLLAALIAGAVLYFVYGDRNVTAVPLVIACVLVAFVLVLVATRVTIAYNRSRRLAAAGVPPGKLLHLFDLRQWLLLLVGLGVIAITTGAFTGVRVLANGETPPEPEPTVALPTPVPTVPVTTAPEPAPEPAETTASADPAESTPESSESADPSAVTDGLPQPGSTTYLDSEEPLEGYYEDKAVAFAATRYPRGITFYCSDATDSAIQWNVAGTDDFHAVAGINDSTGNTFGKVVEFLFYDQDGRKLLPKAVEVSVGHPKEVKFSLDGVTGLRMTCAGRDAKTNQQRSTNASLGDPMAITE